MSNQANSASPGFPSRARRDGSLTEPMIRRGITILAQAIDQIAPLR